MSEQRQPEEELMVALRSMRPHEIFAAEGPVLVGAYVWGVIAFGASNLRGWSYRLCTRTATTVIIDALVGAGPAL